MIFLAGSRLDIESAQGIGSTITPTIVIEPV